MLIIWKDEFCIDHAAIDADHRNIIGRINYIIRAITPGCDLGEISSCLRELYRVTCAHFFRETILQEVSSFPHINEHRKLHERLLSELLDYIQYVEKLASETKGDRHLERELAACKSFLYRWILGHILDQDKKMTEYVEAMRTADDEVLNQDIEDLIPYIVKTAGVNAEMSRVV
ncbi:hemerythrin [Rhodoblastus acidophilus]|uniref:Hemerythrin n=1 Tax=Rhodoblastus acidophilus TaxID=1074 RepID=A0A212RHF9_RHOAC|nr:hemerythrin domain-containing protein [Rhodoblastus acidophilus]PPQ38028.1 hypothetical protein CKO16_11345 [Rhodoblastus acidophilus]RAI24326.1 hypothetical protein CH337_00050 [Rhodoblastus acidophilus]SNB71827.1 hemerythrin [Rhodoblastus acidophilus]